MPSPIRTPPSFPFTCTCFSEWYNLARILSPPIEHAECSSREVCSEDYIPTEHRNPMNEKESMMESVSKGAVGLFVGLALLVAGVWAGRELHIVWNIWPSVDGVVVTGSVEEVLGAPTAKGEPLLHYYKPNVTFRYRALGKEYTTQTTSEYTSDTYQKAAANLLSLYAPGSHHPIRYNPGNPSDIRFGVIDLGPLAFSFLLLIAGVVLSVGGTNSLVIAYSQRIAGAPAAEREVPATVLPFEGRAGVEPAAANLRCPACGRPVAVGEDSCPNCAKSLRAA